MIEPKRTIFLHGLEGSSQGVKATLLRRLFPGLLTPDFSGSLQERMAALYPLLGEDTGWTIIGSSFGGLMGAIFTCQHPQQVKKLILLAAALPWPDFAKQPPEPVSVPVVMYHGTRDNIVPLEAAQRLAEQVFPNLTLHAVDDDHGLYKTVHSLDWQELLDSS
jgi:pimeloyl-ACP methyl ester carboxylesterase